MRKHLALAFACALAASAIVVMLPTGASAAAPNFDARQYLKDHGYLPLQGVDTLEAAKAHAAAVVAAQVADATLAPAAPLAPVIGASWQGTSQNNLTPPDANGAIGPNSFIETVNTRLAIYSRTGASIANSDFSVLTGNSNGSDPMVLWDPHTQRFYYNIWNTANATMDWGFSKDANPDVDSRQLLPLRERLRVRRDQLPRLPEARADQGLPDDRGELLPVVEQ